ncbi:MAG TPA: right-handed parallel beta-helix repeat-containing protein, partial [Nitrospiraceae bacterium]|nr:right-handed parallel beta-helix repeat-containing protein [Nitrospiraceae bacterium]
MVKISKNVATLVMLPLSAVFFFIGVVLAQATTYYVATTGNDSNNGTSVGTPFLTIQKCINVVVAGDTCTVANGTYTVPDATGVVGFMSGANGTPSQPITIKSTNPLGAHVLLTSRNNGNHGFYVGRNYWVIEGFDISGGASNGTSAAHLGFTIQGTTGVTVKNNTIHHIATTVCSMSVFGNAGIYLDGTTSTTLQNNVLHTIGRKRTGESGCGASQNFNDHGIYAEAATNLTITRNLFYLVNRGWPIHIYKSGGGTTTNLAIYHNTFANKSP